MSQPKNTYIKTN